MSQTNWNDFAPVDDKGAQQPKATPESVNWSDFAPADETPSRGFGGWARDIGATAVKGAIGVPEAAVGLADLATGGRVGKFLENEGGAVGFRPKQAKEIANEWHSDATKEAQRKFQEADGIVDKAATAIQNPSLIATAVGESLPSMGAGGVAARGLMAATRLGQMGAKGAALAGAAGEGIAGAGAAAEQIRQETDDGLLTPGQAAAAAGTGVATAGFGALGGKIANRLGIGDAETMLAQGNQGIAKQFADDASRAATNPLVQQQAVKSIPRQVIEGAVAEGFLEELPQSVAEQVFQNLALDKPWYEDVDAAVVMGTLSGAAMGGAAAGYRGFREPSAPEQQPVQPGQPPQQDQQSPAPNPGLDMVRQSYEAQLQALREQEQGEPIVAQTAPPDGAAALAQQRAQAEAERQAAIEASRAVVSPDDEIYQSTGMDQMTPSQRMGLRSGPESGALESAAALAVDAGATAQLQQAAAQAQAQAQATEAAKKVKPAKKKTAQAAEVDPQTGEIASGMAAWSDADLSTAFRGAQSRDVRLQLAKELQRRRAARAETTSSSGTEDAGTTQAITAATTGAMTDGPQAAQAQQAIAQPAQAGNPTPAAGAADTAAAATAPAGGSSLQAAGLTDGRATTEDAGAQSTTAASAQGPTAGEDREQRAQRTREAGAQWTRLTAVERQAAIARAQGIKPVLAKNLPRARWEDLHVDVQRKLADAMAPQAAPATASIKGELGDGVGTYAEKLNARLDDAKHKLMQARGTAPGLRKLNGYDLSALEGEVSRLESMREEAKALDDAALRESIDRGMLKSARQELDATSLTPDQRAQVVQRAGSTGNAVDASRAIFDAVDGGAVTAAANEAATSPQNDHPEPTDAQKEAGNYRKGHVRLNGHEIAIENPAGSKRRPEWPALQNHYGYIKGSMGADKDHVDLFMTDRAHEPDLPVFVVDQVNQDGSFDEHKVVMGAANEAEARRTYLGNYAKGWTGLGAITQMTQDEFKAWVHDAAKTKKPAGKLEKPEAIATTPAARFEQLRAKGGEQAPFKAFGAVAGATGEAYADVWNRWHSVMGFKNAVQTATGEQVAARMQEQLLKAPYGNDAAYPGDGRGMAADASLQAWRNRADKVANHSESFSKELDREELRARDAENFGVAAEAVSAARAAVAEMRKRVAQIERDTQDGLKQAETRAKAEEAAEAKAYQDSFEAPSQSVLAKKPTPASITNWSNPTELRGQLYYTNGHFVDATGTPPHISGWESRIGVRKDIPASSMDRVLSLAGVRNGVLDDGYVNAEPLALVNDKKQGRMFFDVGGRLVAIDLTYAQYFMSKVKAATFMADPNNLDGALRVMYGDKLAGIVMPIRLDSRAPSVEDVRGYMKASGKDKPPSVVARKQAEKAKAQEKARADFQADEFPLQEASASYSGISHSGGQRAKADAQEFERFIAAERDAGMVVADTDVQKAAVEQSVQALRSDYLAAYRRLMGVRAGTYSGYVAGRSGLNTSQADRRNDALDRAIDTFTAWQKGAAGRVRRAALDARTDAQKLADKQAQEQGAADKAQRVEDSDRRLVRKILTWKKGGEPVAVGKSARVAGVNFGRDGYPSSVKLEPTDGSVLTNDKFDLAALFRRNGMSVPDSKRRVRERVDAVRAEDAAQAAAEAQAQPAADEPPKTSDSKTPMLDAHVDLLKRVRNGEATAEQMLESFARLDAGREALAAELSTMNKDDLLRTGGYSFAMRMRDSKKAEIVSAMVDAVLGEYSLGRSFGPTSYMLSAGGLAAHRKAKADALRELVAGLTDEDIAQFARQVAESRAELQARREATQQALENPQTLADFRAVISSHMEKHGDTIHQAYLRLTPEQRLRHDALGAEASKSAREAAKAKQRFQVASASQKTTGEVIATQHTKHGHDLFVVQLADRVSREDYETLNASAKRMGGSYSSYRGNGAVPGFQFRTREAAEAFSKLVAGDEADAQAVAQARRDAFEDDRSQSAVERLRAMATALDERADEQLGRERNANTARRARFAASAEGAARADKALAGTMKNLAAAIEAGTAKFLDAVRQKVQVETLGQYLRSAKDAQIRAKYPSYADQEKHRGEPVDAETVDYAEFPTYVAMRSDLASIARQMLEVDGLKKLGQRLMSVADDVSEAYTAWAKDHLLTVSRFGRGDQLAEFASREDAERAIRRSGLTGRAIVLPIKRGQNRIVLAPSEAMKLGLWEGDGDKRITLSSDVGRELVEALGRRAGGKIKLPWSLEATLEKRKRLEGMGIFTAPEFRSALREFSSIQQAIATPDKIKEMERAMIGRANDGLDFFPTAKAVVESMLDAAEIQDGMAVLEPSAGMGHIADAIVERTGVWPDVVELSPSRRELLEAKGYHLAEVDDFTQMEPRKFFTYGDTFRAPDGVEGIMRGVGHMGSQRVRLEDKDGNRMGLYDRSELTGIAQNGSWSGYDRIVMNPPFSSGRDIEHVQHAYSLLRPGGRIVAIMGEGAFFQSNKRAEAFREWLEQRGATSERLPDGSFMDPSLPVNTSVAARMVVIDKPAESQTDAGAMYRAPDSAAPARPLSLDRVNQLVQEALSGIRGAPPVEVAVRPSDIGLQPPPGSVGYGVTLSSGDIYVFQSAMASDMDVFRTVFHELFHRGVRVVVPKAQYVQTMLDLAKGDSRIQQLAIEWKKTEVGQQQRENLRERGYTGAELTAQYEALAIEEALAEVAEELKAEGRVGTKPKSLTIRYLANWLAKVADLAGMKKLAQHIRGMTYNEAERFVMSAIDRSGEPVPRAGVNNMRSEDAKAGDQTQTEAFKRWFKDSKVVDADGKPLRVFHGTGGDFSVFTRERAGATSRAANAGMGFFFTDRPEIAGTYARMAGGDQNIMPVYLSLQNPVRLQARNMLEADKLLQTELQPEHDGAIIEVALRDGGTQMVFMAREPGQIKSATGNRGTFDPNNADIRYRSADAAGVAGRMGDAVKSVTVQSIKKAARYKKADWLGMGLQALGRRQITEIYGDDLPGLKTYNQLAAQMEADKNEVGAEADALAQRWGKLKDERQLAELMHDATLAQIDPDKEYVEGDDKAQFQALKRRFAALSAEAQAVYRDARGAYADHHAKVRTAIRERIERSEIKGERKAALLARMDDEFFKQTRGVYFPLARFGQYVVAVRGPDGKIASVNRAETMGEAQALRDALVKAFPPSSGHTVIRPTLSKEFVASRDAVGRGFMTELYQVLDKQNMDAAQRAELEDTLGQLYLSSLPDLSWAKHGIHRKGTPGFSQDARRAFAQNMFHGGRYLAKLRYSDLMQDELQAMQKHVDAWKEVEDVDQPSLQRVVDEMEKRHESAMNPKSNPISTALTSLGFVFHLGLSPASAMVNLSQTALVAYPVMAAKWGYDKSAAALLRASKDAAKGKNDITGSLNADERLAYDEAVRAGTIDVTMAHDLAGIAQGEDAKVMWKIRPVMRWASVMFHHAERFNRQVTFVAAYRLARESGASHGAAFEQATDATYKGHFDYSAGNRPRIMQGNVAKVLLLFKQYGQNMVYTLARSAQQSIKGETPEARREARRALSGLLVMHGMAAGALGLPMVTTLLAAASMLGGGEDEPWDAKVALQNVLADALGQKPAEVLMHGLSRLTPWDISGRVGLDRLILPDVQEGLEGQRLWESTATAALGPVAGIAGGLLKGLQTMAGGDWLRGLEEMMPAVARNGLKAIRYGNEGAQDKTGIAILDEVNPAEVAGQALGFSPSRVRNATEGKSAIRAYDSELNRRRASLTKQFAMAQMTGDQEGVQEAREAIARFNEKNPGRRITYPQLMQSVRARQRRIDQAEDGVYLPRNRRDAMEQGRFAGGD